MKDSHKKVEGFHFLPPGLAAWINSFIPEQNYDGLIPWTPLEKPLSEASFALVTSAGISCKEDEPFDMEREKNDPTWGDPSFRKIPRDATESDIRVNHLHINTSYIREDMNVILPIARFAEFEQEGLIGRLADTHYSFYGFQWESDRFLDHAIAPMAEQMSREQVDAVLLTPA
ncbi:MAG: glycine/betaine/sarcosine/D-proline family reductase selenoprotein B [Desulfobacterales bacterium]|nr:glycine/betaine/sarcosine/D-proline family reductase selenoprotein B [Desulfobacterales bacterium]